jgi:hypothetical protein
MVERTHDICKYFSNGLKYGRRNSDLAYDLCIGQAVFIFGPGIFLH